MISKANRAVSSTKRDRVQEITGPAAEPCSHFPRHVWCEKKKTEPTSTSAVQVPAQSPPQTRPMWKSHEDQLNTTLLPSKLPAFKLTATRGMQLDNNISRYLPVVLCDRP